MGTTLTHGLAIGKSQVRLSCFFSADFALRFVVSWFVLEADMARTLDQKIAEAEAGLAVSLHQPETPESCFFAKTKKFHV